MTQKRCFQLHPINVRRTILQEGLVDAMRKRFEEQLENLNKELITMGTLCEDAIVAVVAYMNGLDKKEQIADLEKQIDAKQRAIESLCMKLLLQQQPEICG